MRKKQSKKRDLIPDPKFNDQLVTRFVNNLMQQGKKSTAYKIFYDAIDIIESKKEDKEKTSLGLFLSHYGLFFWFFTTILGPSLQSPFYTSSV